MSEYDEMVSDEDSMIKYLREKITGRPAVFSRAGDLPIDDNLSSIKRTNSQNSLTDIISTNTDTINQVEKFTAISNATTSGRRSISSSSPIIIPKKPSRSNASSQSSSSYTSIADQMSSFCESDDVSNSAFSTLPSTCQQLEHSAARDRISVKNKRRQPIKQKLSTLRENDDNEHDLFSSKMEDDDDEIPPPLPPKQRFLLQQSLSSPPTTSTTKIKKKKLNHDLPLSSTPDEEQLITVTSRVESKIQQPLIDVSDLDTARSRLRMPIRPRDRSVDNNLLTTIVNNDPSTNLPPIAPKLNSCIQRSVSFKRPQELQKTELFNRNNIKIKTEDKNNNENILTITKSIENDEHSSQNDIKTNTNSTQTLSRSSSQEHIYDNLDVFKRSKPTVNSSSNEDESTPIIKTREHSFPSTRLRPVTMHISTNTNDKQTTNEFENVFNQLKKRGSIRRVRPTEEPTVDPPPPPPVEEPPPPPAPTPTPVPPSQPESEPIIAVNKPIEKTQSPQPLSRRKTVGGVHLLSNNKVATDDHKPSPSWIDIAKQKQNKFQLVSNEKSHHDESEQQITNESPVIIRKQTPSIDIRSNRKSMFEQSTIQNNTPVIERDSIRALKAGNPNRINNLIQFFDK